MILLVSKVTLSLEGDSEGVGSMIVSIRQRKMVVYQILEGFVSNLSAKFISLIRYLTVRLISD